MNPPAPRPSSGVIAFTRWFAVLMFLGLGAGGVAAFWHGLQQRKMNAESGGWPTVEGVVTRAWVKTTETKTGNTPSAQERGEMHEVMVDYTFTVDGQALNSSSLAPKQIEEEEGKAAAEAIADAYIPGSKIPAYYQPGNPKQSRLRRVEVSSSAWLWFAVLGGLAIPACLFGTWWMFARFERGRGGEVSSKQT